LLMICFLNGYVSFLLLWDLLLHKEIKIKTWVCTCFIFSFNHVSLFLFFLLKCL
jgi:hypothetical protein